jgi:hypothetical protein
LTQDGSEGFPPGGRAKKELRSAQSTTAAAGTGGRDGEYNSLSAGAA